jgi:hypothetical protein
MFQKSVNRRACSSVMVIHIDTLRASRVVSQSRRPGRLIPCVAALWVIGT